MNNSVALKFLPQDIVDMISAYGTRGIMLDYYDVMKYLNQIYHYPEQQPCEMRKRPATPTFPCTLNFYTHKTRLITNRGPPFSGFRNCMYEQDNRGNRIPLSYKEFCHDAQMYANEYGYAVWVGYEKYWPEMLKLEYRTFITVRPDWDKDATKYHLRRSTQIGERINYNGTVTTRKSHCTHKIPRLDYNMEHDFALVLHHGLPLPPDTRNFEKLFDLQGEIGGYVVPEHGWKHWRATPSCNFCKCLRFRQ